MSTLLTAALETALNRYLALDPEARARLAPLAGRVIALELRGLGLHLFFLPGECDIQILQQCQDVPDATIAGTPLALARLALAERPGEGLFSDAVELRGDTGLAQRFQALLQSVQIDWEEQFSHLVGDRLAHQTGRALRHGRDYAAASAGTLRQNLSEYLTEE
ncbi:MAG TPA: SCP2 sterol-binding domain-containing protein, partial [Thiohalobacter sp.]|nr:SCP2 sterol-binding domain-containing protein [Thiohalobacter sp.]